MTSPIDFTGTMPMQWIFDVDPTQMDVSQRLPVKHGQRSVDRYDSVAVEPGVYIIRWETNVPDTEWKSFYFRDVSNFEGVLHNFGSRNHSGSQRIVIPKKANLYCYAYFANKLEAADPVVGVSLLPLAPLANAFET